MRGLNAAEAGLRRRRSRQTTCTPCSQALRGPQVTLAEDATWQRWVLCATGTCWAAWMPDNLPKG